MPRIKRVHEMSMGEKKFKNFLQEYDQYCEDIKNFYIMKRLHGWELLKEVRKIQIGTYNDGSEFLVLDVSTTKLSDIYRINSDMMPEFYNYIANPKIYKSTKQFDL